MIRVPPLFKRKKRALNGPALCQENLEWASTGIGILDEDPESPTFGDYIIRPINTSALQQDPPLYMLQNFVFNAKISVDENEEIMLTDDLKIILEVE